MSGGAKLEIFGAAAPSNAPLGFADSTGGGGIPSRGGSGSPSVGGGGIAAGSEGGKGKGGRSAGFGGAAPFFFFLRPMIPPYGWPVDFALLL
ncbi:MAG: hypothetical protein CMB49_01215 [Euryarchaeota archaeon]|nr:hypothetical protein [Euryarchaeota archaeon]